MYRRKPTFSEVRDAVRQSDPHTATKIAAGIYRKNPKIRKYLGGLPKWEEATSFQKVVVVIFLAVLGLGTLYSMRPGTEENVNAEPTEIKTREVEQFGVPSNIGDIKKFMETRGLGGPAMENAITKWKQHSGVLTDIIWEYNKYSTIYRIDVNDKLAAKLNGISYSSEDVSSALGRLKVIRTMEDGGAPVILTAVQADILSDLLPLYMEKYIVVHLPKLITDKFGSLGEEQKLDIYELLMKLFGKVPSDTTYEHLFIFAGDTKDPTTFATYLEHLQTNNITEGDIENAIKLFEKCKTNPLAPCETEFDKFAEKYKIINPRHEELIHNFAHWQNYAT